LNAAARLVSGTHKYHRALTQFLHADLHWLHVADRVRYKLDVTVCATKRRSTCQTAVSQCQTSPVVSDYTLNTPVTS